MVLVILKLGFEAQMQRIRCQQIGATRCRHPNSAFRYWGACKHCQESLKIVSGLLMASVQPHADSGQAFSTLLLRSLSYNSVNIA